MVCAITCTKQLSSLSSSWLGVAGVATPFTLVATATGSTTPDFEGFAAFLTLVVTDSGGWTIDGTRSGGTKDVTLTLNLSWGVVSSGALSSTPCH